VITEPASIEDVQASHLKVILNNLSNNVMLTVPDTGEIIFLNESVRHFFGKHSEGTGERCYEFLHNRSKRCDYCPYHILKDEPERKLVWELSEEYIPSRFRITAMMVELPDKRKALLEIGVEITDALLAREALIKREKMLDAINRAAFVLLSRRALSFNEMMDEGIGIIAGIVDIDRISVFRNIAKPDGVYMSQVYRWSKNHGGTTKPLERLTEIPYSVLFPNWEHTVPQGYFLNGPVDDIPLAAGLKQFGCVSIYSVPVYSEGQLWGYTYFENLREKKTFNDYEADMLRSAGFMLSNAVIRNEEARVIREANEHISLMIDNIPIFCMLWDRNFNIIDCNNAALEMFGIKTKQEFKEHFLEWCLPEYQPDGRHSMTVALETQSRGLRTGSGKQELMHQKPDGTPLPIEVSFVRLPYKDDFVLAGYYLDLSKHKEMERGLRSAAVKLQGALNEAQAANRAKSEFLSNISHEIRTPLNAITGMAAIGRSSRTMEKKDYSFGKIDDASKQLLKIIDDVLDMSRIEVNKFKLNDEEFNLAAVMRKAVSSVKPIADKRNHSLRVDIDKAIPITLTGDSARLGQVVVNLLSNAVKFTPDNGVINVNAVLLSKENGMCKVKISVTDNGIGLTGEQKIRIFKAFEQADAGVSRQYGGTGLGLSISKSIVELMGGEIWVESELGHGAAFTFTVTLKWNGGF
jgi:PAS domain S-box-containing protein